MDAVPRGTSRRRVNTALIFAVAFLFLLTGGPSLALASLTPHTVLGVALVLVTLGHVWLHRERAVSWPSSGRRRRQPSTRLTLALESQDALREWSFIATAATGFLLIAGAPGETAHVIAGFTVLGLAVVHAVLHRRWFRALVARRRAGRS